MARPTKQGIDYFPVDVQFDDKIELLIAEKGGNALAVIVTIWQLIYQNEGYYISNGKDLFLLVKRRIMTDLEMIESVVKISLERGIFNNELHKKYKILTSKAIQKRYFEASKRKKTVNVNKNYICLGVNVNIYEHIVYINATKEEVEVKVKVKVNEKNNYKGVYDYYLSMPNLIKHKKYTPAIYDAIKKAMKNLSITIEDCKTLIKKHSELIKLNSGGKYDIEVRPIEVFFGQKLYKGGGLICSEYLEGGIKSNNLLKKKNEEEETDYTMVRSESGFFRV